MKMSPRLIAGLGLAASCLISSGTAQAQDTRFQLGPATFTIGTGTAMLNLPDVGSMVTRGPNSAGGPNAFQVVESFEFSNHFGNNVGWNINGSIAAPIGGATVSLNGFWAQITGKDSFLCAPQPGADLCAIMPLVDKPAIVPVNGVLGPTNATYGGQLWSDSERKVDHWGAALESKWDITPPRFIAGALDRQYLALGGDIRGIYQDLDSTIASVNTVSPTFKFTDTYTETLKATYYGAYLAWGGDYTPILFKSLWELWGLQSSFRVQGGVYFADTQYDGRLVNIGPIIGGGGDPSSALELSRDDTVFIGGITLETRKQINKRTMLSLKSEYEYYSYVPRMIYNTGHLGNNPFLGGRQFGTFIDSTDTFSARTSLRLTIGLGPDSLFK